MQPVQDDRRKANRQHQLPAQKFFKGGGTVFRKVLKILRLLFFRSTNLIFRAHRKYYKNPILSKKFFAAGDFFKKKTGQKRRYEHFLENFDQKKLRPLRHATGQHSGLRKCIFSGIVSGAWAATISLPVELIFKHGRSLRQN